MFNLIPISLLIGALGGILYIVSNHLSELNNNSEEDKSDVFGFNLKARFVEWTNQLPLDNIKSQSLSLTQKLLHRFRLALLKTDNHLMKLIGKISQRDKTLNGNGGGEKSEAAPDFWRDFSDDKQEKEEVIPKPVSEVKIEFALEKDRQVEKFFDIKPAKKTLKIKKSSSK